MIGKLLFKKSFGVRHRRNAEFPDTGFVFGIDSLAVGTLFFRNCRKLFKNIFRLAPDIEFTRFDFGISGLCFEGDIAPFNAAGFAFDIKIKTERSFCLIRKFFHAGKLLPFSGSGFEKYSHPGAVGTVVVDTDIGKNITFFAGNKINGAVFSGKSQLRSRRKLDGIVAS